MERKYLLVNNNEIPLEDGLSIESGRFNSGIVIVLEKANEAYLKHFGAKLVELPNSTHYNLIDCGDTSQEYRKNLIDAINQVDITNIFAYEEVQKYIQVVSTEKKVISLRTKTIDNS